MAQYIFHQSATREHAHHDWLDSRKTFSFGDYYNPRRMGFGALRVLNDDSLPGGKGFGLHPHDNMEIISIPLKGSLKHEDSAGNKAVAAAGTIQVMHAGSGLFHSEYNNSTEEVAEFLQIWVYPEVLNTPPRYTLGDLTQHATGNQLHTFIAPDDSNGIYVRKDVWFSMGNFDAGSSFTYPVHQPGNGVYAFAIAGRFTIDGKELSARDGLGIWDTSGITVKAENNNARLLIMEVPMHIHP
ncbi:pirin family protein [Chitinophaga nivalis]|uniref:Pirin family protein n=1 Tax=Chitinophaga nivalis TaxID=2991709 RepID=A0ABT3IQW1_9BACT|nr:pirin family protein [Chitinophaga nivalis]MCW3463943.1 pirin family protein [Chitinophaga nivalis]MCW3486367.1 pirin family protein [Chitinophaga nivalis]